MMGMEASLCSSSSVEWLYTRARTTSQNPDRTLWTNVVFITWLLEPFPHTLFIRDVSTQVWPGRVSAALVHSQVNILRGEETGMTTQQSKPCKNKTWKTFSSTTREVVVLNNTRPLQCRVCVCVFRELCFHTALVLLLQDHSKSGLSALLLCYINNGFVETTQLISE